MSAILPDTDLQAVRRGKLTGTEKSRETKRVTQTFQGMRFQE